MIQFFKHIEYLSLVTYNFVISDEVDMDREISAEIDAMFTWKSFRDHCKKN